MKNNQKNRFAVFVVLALFCLSFLLVPAHAEAAVIYVDKDATGAGNGTSWPDAFVFLQDAIAAHSSGDEIWVAAGTYYPDEGNGQTDNDRSSTFYLPIFGKLTLYGGFDGTDGTGGGCLETNPSQRDWETNVTILSGDLAQDDVGFTNNDENAYHVISIFSNCDDRLIDGFTVTAGNANKNTDPDSTIDGKGGGLVLDPGLCTGSYDKKTEIYNCTFTNNHARVSGGGVYVFGKAAIFHNCIFDGNKSDMSGGGIWSYVPNDPHGGPGPGLKMYDCVIINNTANSGGGITNRSEILDGSDHSPILINCLFIGNSAATSGGAMSNEGMYGGGLAPSLINCVFSGNSANYGGAVYNQGDVGTCNPSFTNCTFSGNKAINSGNEIYNYKYRILTYGECKPKLTNCIIWNDSPIYNATTFGNTPIPTYAYCDIKGSGSSASWLASLGTDLGGNIDVDPLFIDPPVPANAPTIAGDVHLLEGSPCIDTGTATGAPATDMDGNARDAMPDIGADEYLPDTDGDGEPDITDGCPNDPDKTAPGACGCGVADVDSDNDGTLDCNDGCPNDAAKTAPGTCGCGIADTDSDGDASPDCNDGCPNDPNKMSAGVCGCGTPDIDANGNGIMDCLEQPPDDDTEVCDGIDNDLDGFVDEGCVPWYRDSDSDGYGDPAVSIIAIDQPAGYVSDNTDCDDANAAVHPNAAEVCGNGIDEDCSGADLACGGGGANLPPMADAGEDRGVAQGTAVNLDGSDSYDPDDGIAAYLWTQTAGPTMALSDPAAVQPTFTVPADALGAALTFQLTVTDRSGVTDTDSVTLTIVDQACNTRPDKPVLVSPANGATGVSLTPTLQSGPYSDPGDCSTHFKTRWQISEQTDFSGLTYNANTFYDELTAHQVTKKVLKPNTTYYWRVKFWGDHGVKSEWSDVFTFTTGPEAADNNGNGLPDGQEPGTDTDVNENGIPDAQEPNLRALLTADGNAIIGLGFADDILSIAIETMNEDEIGDTTNMPGSFPYGLIAFRVMLANPGAAVSFTVYLQEAAPVDAAWYKYDTVNGWYDFTAQVVFSPNRKSLTFTLTDGGTGDADGVVNGVIVDPAGLAAEAEDGSTSPGHGGGGSSCFIDTSTNK